MNEREFCPEMSADLKNKATNLRRRKLQQWCSCYFVIRFDGLPNVICEQFLNKISSPYFIVYAETRIQSI